LTLFDAGWIEDEDRRNLVRQEVRRAIFYGDLEGDPSEYTHEGGACFSALWDGNLYEAFRHHADIIQCSQLESVFGEARINADRPDQNAPVVSELDPDRHFICLRPFPGLDSE